jgi:predicted house-cleaning noncanonical NTP pyrophosphatase (MazG superfamily)
VKKTRTFRLGKIVRDKLVARHEDMGGSVIHRQLEGSELITALANKVIEEAKELQENPTADEIADVREALSQIATRCGISETDIAAAQERKREKNGGFENGDYIETVTLPADNEWANYYAQNPERFPEE